MKKQESAEKRKRARMKNALSSTAESYLTPTVEASMIIEQKNQKYPTRNPQHTIRFHHLTHSRCRGRTYHLFEIIVFHHVDFPRMTRSYIDFVGMVQSSRTSMLDHIIILLAVATQMSYTQFLCDQGP